MLQQHSLPASLEGINAPLKPDVPYSYVVFNLFGWITITRRSINLAITASALTFCALQSASLCLVTTPGEEMALGLSRQADMTASSLAIKTRGLIQGLQL